MRASKSVKNIYSGRVGIYLKCKPVHIQYLRMHLKIIEYLIFDLFTLFHHAISYVEQTAKMNFILLQGFDSLGKLGSCVRFNRHLINIIFSSNRAVYAF